MRPTLARSIQRRNSAERLRKAAFVAVCYEAVLASLGAPASSCSTRTGKGAAETQPTSQKLSWRSRACDVGARADRFIVVPIDEPNPSRMLENSQSGFEQEREARRHGARRLASGTPATEPSGPRWASRAGRDGDAPP